MCSTFCSWSQRQFEDGVVLSLHSCQRVHFHSLMTVVCEWNSSNVTVTGREPQIWCSRSEGMIKKCEGAGGGTTNLHALRVTEQRLSSLSLSLTLLLSYSLSDLTPLLSTLFLPPLLLLLLLPSSPSVHTNMFFICSRIVFPARLCWSDAPQSQVNSPASYRFPVPSALLTDGFIPIFAWLQYFFFFFLLFFLN